MHGHDDAAKHELARFLEKGGLKPAYEDDDFCKDLGNTSTVEKLGQFAILPLPTP